MDKEKEPRLDGNQQAADRICIDCRDICYNMIKQEGKEFNYRALLLMDYVFLGLRGVINRRRLGMSIKEANHFWTVKKDNFMILAYGVKPDSLPRLMTFGEENDYYQGELLLFYRGKAFGEIWKTTDIVRGTIFKRIRRANLHDALRYREKILPSSQLNLEL